MIYNRDVVKDKVEKAIKDAFSARNTINVQLATGFHVMIEAIFDELERAQEPKKKVA